MKFLVVSDIHASGSALDWINDRIARHKVDGILVLGDVTHFGPLQWALDFLSALRAPAYVIPGNCDPLDLPEEVESVATNMHGRSMGLGKHQLVGLGGSNPTIFNTPFELSEGEILSRLEKISSAGMVLMTHTPPFGTHDQIPSGINVGSTSVAEIVRRFRPKVVLSGHVHEARAVTNKDGILYMNPGPAKDGYAGLLILDDGEPKASLI